MLQLCNENSYGWDRIPSFIGRDARHLRVSSSSRPFLIRALRCASAGPIRLPVIDMRDSSLAAAPKPRLRDGVVVVLVDGHLHAVSTAHIREVMRMVEVTPVPGAPAWFAGMINMRGEVLPVVDVRTYGGVSASPYGLSTPMMIVDVDDVSMAVIVDEIVELVAEGLECVELATGRVVRVGPSLLPLVDVEAIARDLQQRRIASG